MQTNPSNTHVNQASQYDDEIDLFELFQTLWAQKWLILSTSILAPVLAYVFLSSQPIKPDVFQGSALMEIGVYASEQGQLYNIERSQDLALIMEQQLGLKTTIPKASVKLLEIQTSSTDKKVAADQLDSAINFMISRHEKFTASQPNINIVQPTQVVGQSDVTLVKPKDKLKLVLAVAFVLGGMLGVFIALIRSAIQKRRAQNVAA